MNHESVV